MNDATTNDDDMQPEYDFSRAERGKHYAGPNAVFHVPVYLDQDVREYLSRKAEEKGASLSQLVNEILKCDIALIESLKYPGSNGSAFRGSHAEHIAIAVAGFTMLPSPARATGSR